MSEQQNENSENAHVPTVTSVDFEQAAQQEANPTPVLQPADGNEDGRQNQSAAQPQQVAAPQGSNVTPNLNGVPEDDKAEANDADVQHKASPEEVDKA